MCDPGKVVKQAVQISSPLVGSAWAAQDAADAQGRIAEAQLGQQREDRALALQAAAPSAEEIAQVNRAISLNESDIVRKERLLASSDPALIEAGKQALNLLRGEEAKTLGPLRSRIAKDEQTLRQKLASQLGTGYENTTAGIQALNAFQESSNNALSSAQNQTLAQLLGVAQDTSSRYGMQTNIANSGSIAGILGGQSNRRVAAITGAPITAAGAQFVNDLQSARGVQQSIAQMYQLAGMAVPYLSGIGSGGGQSPTAGGANFSNQPTGASQANMGY